ncbi:MAG: hypothetical protein OXU37_01305 [Thaumarchaeota archaeon]|nr:hypothetical protein [Nitrososphaerota archaeon]RNJ72291.1 MAG: hypothetical protein EB832_04090 [Thaumarchaeota archaeon S14]RNJ73582.1 MAG: hypothetical protein EB833_02490 [Thaumarchaeota archaeon S13]RNJ75390.1 MAG: hypothetical protein EB824_01745 [Thaumarchaeota archaeon S15]
MALEGTGLPMARVRVDRGLGRVFLTLASGNGAGEVAIDVLPSQLPGIVAEFGNDGRPIKDPPAMSPEDLEELKGKIMKMTKSRDQFYPGEIAVKLGLEHDVVIEAIYTLQREGKLRESDDP